MPLDLYQTETDQHLARLRPAEDPQVGVFEGFARGTAMTTMRGLTQLGSSIDLLGAVGPIAQDAMTGGTEAQDRYFREHENLYGKAIDFWTPRPNEVGAAAEITGSLLSMIPQVIISPALAVAATQISSAEQLVKQGVDARTAQMVGASQAIGLGLGLYVPIFGRTIAQRIFAGGIGFNVAQGIAMRGVAEQLLEGTPAAEQYRAFDPTQLTLDTLLGAAFGAIVHLTPAGRAQSAEAWNRIEAWGKGLKPSDVAALAVLRQAQHLNADSLPGRPVDPVDVERHVQRMRKALEQIVRDEPVNVSDLEQPRFDPDPVRAKEAEANARALSNIAEEVRAQNNLPEPPTVAAPESGRIVYRIGYEGETSAAGKWVGTPERLVRHAAQYDEMLAQSGDVLYAYRVDPSDTRIGQVNKVFPGMSATEEKLSADARTELVAKVPLKSIKGELTPDKIVEAFASHVSEAPAAIRGEAAAPPPRGPRGVEAAGAKAIPRAKNLSAIQREVETRFANQIGANLDEAVRRYAALPGTEGGKIINADLARELSPDYAQDRSRLSSAVHEPASYLVKEMYARRLAEPDPTGLKTVMFTAGGTGAGKTTAINNTPEAALTKQQAHVIYDTNMNTFQSAVTKIDQALKADNIVWIYTVVRDPVESLTAGALPRAERMGRTVPIEEHARTHVGVREVIPKLIKHYADDPRVKFEFIDNTNGKGNAKLGSEKLLKPLDFAKLESKLYGALEKEYQNGRISKAVYQGTLGDAARGAAEGAPGDVTGRAPPSDLPSTGRLAEQADSGTRAAVDPLANQAERVSAQYPDLQLHVGQNADGSPIVRTMREYLDDARTSAREARENANLFRYAAECLFG